MVEVATFAESFFCLFPFPAEPTAKQNLRKKVGTSRGNAGPGGSKYLYAFGSLTPNTISAFSSRNIFLVCDMQGLQGFACVGLRGLRLGEGGFLLFLCFISPLPFWSLLQYD